MLIEWRQEARIDMNGKEDKILNVEELSKFFGVSSQTIWRWCKAGKIPAFKIGSQWKIRQSDLNKIINQKLTKNNKNSSFPFILMPTKNSNIVYIFTASR
jgi:excisionase family DNA binding protein